MRRQGRPFQDVENSQATTARQLPESHLCKVTVLQESMQPGQNEP